MKRAIYSIQSVRMDRILREGGKMSKGFRVTETSILEVLPKVAVPHTIVMPDQRKQQVKYAMAKELHKAIHPEDYWEFRESSTRRAARKLGFAGQVQIFYIQVNGGPYQLAVGLPPNNRPLF